MLTKAKKLHLEMVTLDPSSIRKLIPLDNNLSTKLKEFFSASNGLDAKFQKKLWNMSQDIKIC